MKIFIDTEFTDFANPELISIALVAEDGRELYLENAKVELSKCSRFTMSTVLPLLGRRLNNVCNARDLSQRLNAWFDALPDSVTIVSDFPLDDDLLRTALRDTSQIRIQLCQPLILDRYVVNDPIFRRAACRAYTEECPSHHALGDARALRAGYIAWLMARTDTVSGLSSRLDKSVKAHSGPTQHRVKASPTLQAASMMKDTSLAWLSPKAAD